MADDGGKCKSGRPKQLQQSKMEGEGRGDVVVVERKTKKKGRKR